MHSQLVIIADRCTSNIQEYTHICDLSLMIRPKFWMELMHILYFKHILFRRKVQIGERMQMFQKCYGTKGLENHLDLNFF